VNTSKPAAARPFQIYAWGVVTYHLAVIVWGAFVRATGSGAGCGEHWPLCNGAAIPPSPTLATIIEFSHRLTSGLALASALGLLIWAFRRFPKRHLARRAAMAAIGFELMEAVIGAALVLLGQVAKNASTGRAYTLSIHLVNTLLLVAALTLAAWAGGKSKISWRTGKGFRLVFALGAAGFLLLGVSGTIAALGDTLFHATSFSSGFQQDFAAHAHPFIRLRVWHPLIAAFVGCGLATLAYILILRNISRGTLRMAYSVLGLVVVQLGVGMINLAMMAPVALQLIHLLLADLLWISFVILGAEVLLNGDLSAMQTTEPGESKPAGQITLEPVV
jgi:heme A synthase